MSDDCFDFAALAPPERYKLLAGLVVPRPIALVTTIDAAGLVNAAPFSFFNVFAEDPALVVLGLQAHPDGRLKDTTRNIRSAGTFVVNLVDEPFVKAMNDCAMEFPADVGEPRALGLDCVQSLHVPVPRLAAAPVALECRQVTMMCFGPTRDLAVGEVLAMHVRSGIVDPKTLRTDYAAFAPVARLGGPYYARLHQRFELERNSLAAWSVGQAEDAP